MLPDDLDGAAPTPRREDKDARRRHPGHGRQVLPDSIGDLAPVAGDLTLGGPPEWKTRQTGVPGPRRRSTASSSATSPSTDAGGPLTLNALLDDRVARRQPVHHRPEHRGRATSSSLDDPESLFAAQNVVPLVQPRTRDSHEVEDALNAVSEALDTATLGDLVTQVVIDKEDPEDVAERVPRRERPQLTPSRDVMTERSSPPDSLRRARLRLTVGQARGMTTLTVPGPVQGPAALRQRRLDERGAGRGVRAATR